MTDVAEARPETNAKPTAAKPPRLPRLGQTTAARKTKEVELPDTGASLLLRKPTVATILELQEKVDFDNADMRQMYGGTVGLIASMLVDPELTEDELRAHTDDLSFADWQHLQQEALELAGLGEEARQRTAADFQRPAERP